MIILKDVNLAEISFSSNGRDLTFNFLNMFDGNFLTTIKCKNVFAFNYNNYFKDDDGGFACWVAEVGYRETSHSQLDRWLKDKNLINVYMESGEISIDIACEILEQDGKLVIGLDNPITKNEG